MYADGGRPSVPPERLLKACLLIALYTVRSERQFCEQLDYNYDGVQQPTPSCASGQPFVQQLHSPLNPGGRQVEHPARSFDALAPGPALVGYGNFVRAAHSSFADLCEVPEVPRGRPAACEPEFLPRRHGRHVENYLAVNFLDAVLRDDAEALARLQPDALAGVEQLAYQLDGD